MANIKKRIIALPIVLACSNLILYYGDVIDGFDLAYCLLGYFIIWAILKTALDDEGVVEGINEGVSEGVKKGINMKAFREWEERRAKIDKYIEEGKEIPPELTKNFVTFPLVDDPYKDLE